jgi:ABC-type nitrate/sulfonate/bicarbonate transport system substrate-binding protein
LVAAIFLPFKSFRLLIGEFFAITSAVHSGWLCTKRDVQLVHLQHPDGKTALERGQVDAWAGLDPLMAWLVHRL